MMEALGNGMPEVATMTLKPGEARSEAVSVQQLLDGDTRTVPPVLRQDYSSHLGSERLPTARWTSSEFARLEMDRMWSRVWQFACREEHLPAVGDYTTYEIGDWSFLIVRVSPVTIKAYWNACLHRGNQLKPEGTHGNVDQLRCSFHGFTWTLAGDLADVPCRWDFPHVNDAEYHLPEVKVGTWGGFVFLNPDPDCAPLEDFLGGMIDEFADWDFENKFIKHHLIKRVDMNWKVGIEAFIESFHVLETHPQIMLFTADANTQYDVDPALNYNRMITASAVASPHLRNVTEQAIVDIMISRDYRTGVKNASVELPEGMTARVFEAERRRRLLGEQFNRDYSTASDCEMLDAIEYWVFPNWFPWGGFGMNLVYRFRPDGDNPQSSLMEVMILSDYDLSGPRPEPAPLRWLSEDEDWISAQAQIGALAMVYQQDMTNMPRVHNGMKSLRQGVTLGNYQENRIRHMHRKIDEYIAAGPAEGKRL